MAETPSQQSMSMNQRTQILWLSAWGLLVALQLISPLWYPTPDGCSYLSIARSLAANGQPTNLGSDNLYYSIGYPILIAPVFLVAGSPFLLLSVIHAVLTGVYLAGTYMWVRRHVAEAALPIALLAVGNVIVLLIFRRVLSEVAFMAVMVWFFNLLAMIRQDDRIRWPVFLTAAVLLIVVALIRPTGLLFAGGFGLVMLNSARKRKLSCSRACLLTLGMGLPAALTLSAVMLHDRELRAQEGGQSYLDVLARSPRAPEYDFQDPSLFRQCLEGVRVRISEVGRLTIPGMFGCYGGRGDWLNVNMLVYVPFCALLVLGWCRVARLQPDAFVLSLPLYVALHIYWPFDQGARFFAPLLPLLLICLWFGLERLGRRRQLLLRGLVAAHLAVALGHWIFLDLPRAVENNRNWADVQCLAASISTDPGAVQVTPRLGDTRFLLTYLLDQRVDLEPPEQTIQPGVRWLVVVGDDPSPDGFAPCLILGKYKLLHRQSEDEVVSGEW